MDKAVKTPMFNSSATLATLAGKSPGQNRKCTIKSGFVQHQRSTSTAQAVIADNWLSVGCKQKKAKEMQKSKYNFYLNPHDEYKWTKCPKCDNKTKVKKYCLMIYYEEKTVNFNQLISLKKIMQILSIL
ncbi:MAG: hypothetical protein AAF433_22565 [Bacteroidota bacterium]